jgi:ribosome-associated protein
VYKRQARITKKLFRRINTAGSLKLSSQTARSQLENKQLVVQRMNEMVANALIIPKKRKASKPTKASVEARLAGKKQAGETKLNRKKVSFNG